MKETIQLLGYPHFWQPPYVWGPRSCSSELTNLSTEAPSDVGGSARPALRPLLYATERRGGAVDWKQNIHFTSCGNMWYYVVIFHQVIAGHRDVLIQKHVYTKQETKIGTPNTVCRWWQQPILACLIMESLQRSYWWWIHVNTPDSWNVPLRRSKKDDFQFGISSSNPTFHRFWSEASISFFAHHAPSPTKVINHGNEVFSPLDMFILFGRSQMASHMDHFPQLITSFLIEMAIVDFGFYRYTPFSDTS